MQINNIQSRYVLTADIGGSHITAGLYDQNSSTLLKQSICRVEVYSKGSADEILTAWKTAFEQVVENNPGLPISGLTIAMPGPFDYENGISYIKNLDKYESLYGRNVKEYLAEILKLKPNQVKFRNDAEATIAGEVYCGAGQLHQRVLGITLGTGFGSAYSNNKVTHDINLGGTPYKKTIADDYFSTRWFLRRYHQVTGLSLTNGVEELFEMASQSSNAREIFKEFATNLNQFLESPIKELKPELLILCGNISKASSFFLPYLKLGVAIKIAQLYEDAPLIGAASIFHEPLPAGQNTL